MNNQAEENLSLFSDEQLIELIDNIHDEIEQIKKKILPIKSEQMKRKLINLLNLTKEDLINVTNFNVFCKMKKSYGTRDEYAHTYEGNLKIRYDYNQEQSEKVSVYFNVNYLEEQTYYNIKTDRNKFRCYSNGANKSE